MWRFCFAFVLTTTSCTTWYTVQKDQLPLIATAFKTGESVHVATDDKSIEADPSRRIRVRTDTRGLLFEGHLTMLEFQDIGSELFIRIEPGPPLYAQPHRGPLAGGGLVQASMINSVEVETFSPTKTAIAIAGPVLVVTALVCVIAASWDGIDFDLDLHG